MTVLEWALGTALALWWLLSAVHPFARASRWIAPRDWMFIVPTWTLFARPRMHDPVLLRREISPDGRLSSWREELIIAERPWWSFVWHPQLGPKRALLTFVAGVTAAAGRRAQRSDIPAGQGTAGANLVMSNDSYLALLNYVSTRCGPDAQAVQFMIVGVRNLAMTGRWDLTQGGFIVFVSEFHRLQSTLRPGHRDVVRDALVAG